MYKKSFILSLFVSFISSCSWAQCDCAKTLSAVISSVEENYVAFKEKTAGKKKEYNAFKKNILLACNKEGFFHTYQLVNRYFGFFNEPHLSTGLNYNKETAGFFRNEFSKLPVLPNWQSMANKRIDLSDSLSGLWTSKELNFEIQVFPVAKKKYVGVISKADSIFWHPGQVKLEIDLNKTPSHVKVYRRDHMPRNFKFKVAGNKLYIPGLGILTKYPEPDNYVKKTFAFEKLDSSSCLIRLPDFLQSSKQKIDSLVGNNFNTITKCENLIIDLRDNGGGFSSCFDTILPLIHSGNIKKPPYYILASDGNIELFRQFGIKNNIPDSTFMVLNMLKANRGKMTEVVKSYTGTITHIYTWPKRVVFLVNSATGSSAEDLLLTARQSKKVIIMGDYTKGALDNQSTLMPRVIPGCEYFSYNCPTTTSRGGPKIDNIGIKPDVFIDMNDDWIKFTLNYLSKH